MIIKIFYYAVQMLYNASVCVYVAVTAVSSIVDLITLNGVKFSTAFLCRLMEKCAVQTSDLASSSPSSPSMTSVAETLLSAIEESRGGQLIPEDYHFYINTLINFKATQQ